jgi:hypothetical protein
MILSRSINFLDHQVSIQKLGKLIQELHTSSYNNSTQDHKQQTTIQ